MVVRYNDEVVLYLLILVSMIVNTFAVKYDAFQEINDNELYSPNEISENNLSNSAIDSQPSIQQINGPGNIYSDVYSDLNSIEIRRTPTDVKDEASFDNKFKSNEIFNVNSIVNDLSDDSQNSDINIKNTVYKPKKNSRNKIDRNLFMQNNNGYLQDRCENNQIYFNLDRTNNLITNDSNESELINQKKLLRNLDKRVDKESRNKIGRVNKFQYENKKCKCHKGKQNDTECKKESVKTFYATLEKFSGHICTPKSHPSCASLDEEYMKNKSKQSDKWEPKDLGILQPIKDGPNFMAMRVKDRNKIHNKKYNYGTKLSNDLPVNSIYRKYNREYYKNENSQDNGNYNVKDRLSLIGHKIKTKPYMKYNHENELQYDRYNYKMMNYKKLLKDSFYKQQFPKLKQETEYQSHQPDIEFNEIPKRINKNDQISNIKYGSKHSFQDTVFSNIKKGNNAVIPYKIHTHQNEQGGILESAPSIVLPKFQQHSDLNTGKRYDVAKNIDKNLLFKQKIKAYRHNNAVFEHMRKTNADNYDYVPHHSSCRLNELSSLTKNKENLQVPFKNIIYNNYINDVIPLNDTNNITFIDSDYITDTEGDADLNIGVKNEFKRSSENFINNLINHNEYLTNSNHKINNKSEYNIAMFNNQDSEFYNDLEIKDELEDQKKRSLNADQDQMLNSNKLNPKDSTDKDELTDTDVSKPNKEISKHGNDHYVPRKDDTNDDNDNENNRHSDNPMNNESSEQSIESNHSSKKLPLIDTIHKKKTKLQGNKNTCLISKNSDNSHKHGYGEEKYKYKNKEPIDIKNEPSYKVTTSISPKKLTENGKPKFKDRTSIRPQEKQCHPQAGPPKFKWCSDEMNTVKDQEYEDALKGKIALRIVEVILAKVHKSSKMSYDFGFCRNQKKTGNEDENNCEAENSILKSQDLKEIMASMEKLSCKSCNQLPAKLKEFLEWLIKVKSVRSVHIKDNPFGKHSNCSIGDSAFLFHQYDQPLSFVNKANNNKNIDNNNNDGQTDYYNSPFEAIRNCEYNDQINKVQPVIDINNEAERDLNLLRSAAHGEQNDVILEQQNQLYNGKLKRYAEDTEYNYPDNNYNFMTNVNSQPYLRNDYEPKDNMYSNLDNSYDYYMNKMKNIDEPKNEPKEFNTLQKANSDNINTFYSHLYNRDKYRKQIPSDSAQYEKNSNYKIDDMEQTFENLGQVRRKRNQKKLPLQELLLDKQPDINFGIPVDQPVIKNEMRDIIQKNGDSDQLKNIADENDQQLGFYTPVVFRNPDDYEIM